MATTHSNSLKSWLESLGAFFYPEVCQICEEQRASSVEGYVCASCRQGVRFIQPPFCERCGLPCAGEVTTAFACGNCRSMELHFRFARAAVPFGGMVQTVIHRYKYQQALWFEPFLAGLLVSQAGPLLCRETWNMIVPVPLHSAKFREREFNQAERLARHLGQATHIPLNARLLRRVEATRTQTMLTPAQRVANVRNAFAVRSDGRLEGARIVLVDDVLTTGATASACARVLRKAGAEEVCVWTVSRAVPQPVTSTQPS